MGESSTSGTPHNYSRKGKATSGAHRRRSPLRDSSPSEAKRSHSRMREVTSGAHIITPQTASTATLQEENTSHPHALPHIPHVPTAVHNETGRVTTNAVTRPEDTAKLQLTPNSTVEQITQTPRSA